MPSLKAEWDADSFLIIGITVLVGVGLMAGTIMTLGLPTWIAQVGAVLGGVIGGVVTCIGIIAKGVEVGNRS